MIADSERKEKVEANDATMQLSISLKEKVWKCTMTTFCSINILDLTTLIPPNSRILRVGIFGNVSLEPRVFSTKSGFQTRYLLNNKNSELENSASLEPRFREGLVYSQSELFRFPTRKQMWIKNLARLRQLQSKVGASHITSVCISYQNFDWK